MKKWYYWFFLSAAFALGGVLNYFDGRQITASLIQVSLTVILGFLQFFCERKGERGKRIFNIIAMAAALLLLLGLIWLLISTFA